MPDIFGTRGRKLKEDGLGVPTETRYFHGRPLDIFDNATFANGSLIGEKCYLGEVPSHAVLRPNSIIYFGAFGTNCTLNIGDAENDDGLATLINVASAGNSPVLEAVTVANAVKPLWEVLGYTKDPKRALDLYASIAGANVSTATATLAWYLNFGT